MDHAARARTLAVITFIGVAGAAALYFAQRRTVARGEVLAKMVMDSNLIEAGPGLQKLECDKEVPLSKSGAEFKCLAFMGNGLRVDYAFRLDRDGRLMRIDGRSSGIPRSDVP